MWTTIWTAIKAVLKTITKYAFKFLLRRTGVFGIYGTMKTFGGFRKLIKATHKSKTAFNIFKRLVKKNALRHLHSANFILNIKKFGIKEASKRIVKNRFVPMEFRKIAWFMKELKKSMNKQVILNDVEKIIMGKGSIEKGRALIDKKQVRISEKEREQQVEIIDGVINSKPRIEEEKELKQRFKNKTLVFNVNSPETHNFSQRFHFYNIQTKEYRVPIRSGSKAYWKYYTYNGIPWKIVKDAINKLDYGKLVFNRFRTDRK